MSELIEMLVRGFVALLEFALEAARLLISGSITLVAWCCSKTFRERKRAEWQHKKFRQFLEFGWSGFCIAALVAIPIWLSWPESDPKRAGDVAVEFEKAQAGEDFRVRLRTTNTNASGPGTNLLIVVGEGGTARILGTESLEELKQQVQANVNVFGEKQNQTNAGGIRQLSDRMID